MKVEKSSYTCTACGKNFSISISNAGYPGGKDRESINCPWCGTENGTIITSGIITSYREEKGGDSR